MASSIKPKKLSILLPEIQAKSFLEQLREPSKSIQYDVQPYSKSRRDTPENAQSQLNSTRSQLNKKPDKVQPKKKEKQINPAKARQQKSPTSLADAPINDFLSPVYDLSSDEDETTKGIELGKPFKLRRKNCSFCQGYVQYKGCRLPKKYSNLFTINKFRKPGEKFVISQRLFLSNENANSEDRRMLPALIINMDGALGYWNVSSKIKHFVLRHGIVDALIRLSYDFRLVAVSSQSQRNIARLVFGLMNAHVD